MFTHYFCRLKSILSTLQIQFYKVCIRTCIAGQLQNWWQLLFWKAESKVAKVWKYSQIQNEYCMRSEATFMRVLQTHNTALSDVYLMCPLLFTWNCPLSDTHFNKSWIFAQDLTIKKCTFASLERKWLLFLADFWLPLQIIFFAQTQKRWINTLKTLKHLELYANSLLETPISPLIPLVNFINLQEWIMILSTFKG